MISRLLKAIFWVIVPVAVVLTVLSSIADAGFKRTHEGYFGVWNAIYSGKIHADLLVMGGSRSWVGLSPVILDSTLGTHTYNLAIDGWSFRMQYARLKVYLQHNPPPKYILQGMDLGTLHSNKELYGDYQFLPYFSDPLIREACKGYEGDPGALAGYVPFFKYSRHQLLAISGYMKFLNHGSASGAECWDENGYAPSDRPFDDSFESFAAAHAPHSVPLWTDTATLHAFEDYLTFCRDHGIKVILVYLPEYHEVLPYYKNRDSLMACYRSYATRYHIPFEDFTQDSLSYSRAYFYNSQHLNKTGAEIFTRKFADSVKTLLDHPIP
jgi:hypothetical protein